MNLLERAALQLGVKHVWRKKVMGTGLRRYASLFSVLFLALIVGLEATGNREAAEAVRTIGGYIELEDHAPIPKDQLLPLLGSIFAGALALLKLVKVLRGKWGGALPTVPLPEARQALGVMGGTLDGPGAQAPVGNQDLGAAIAVIKANPNGVVDGLKILLKVVLALFSRPKKAQGVMGGGLWALVLAFPLLGLLSGCAALLEVLPPPAPGTDPSKPPPATQKEPLCNPAAGLVRECYHYPAEGERYNCADGSTVNASAECPAAPPSPPGPQCAPLAGPARCTERKDLPPDARGAHDDAVNRAIDSACARAGMACGPDGPARPARWAWDALVWEVGQDLIDQGLCVTYDYGHGEAKGRASELSVRTPASSSVYAYQIETAEGRIRRPPGAWRSVCEGGGEGQALRPPAPADPAPGPTPSPSPRPTPDLTCRKPTKVEVKRHSVAPQGAVVYDATFKAPDRTRCLSLGKDQDFCGLGPDCLAPGEGTTPEAKALEDERCPAWRSAKEACEAEMIGPDGPTWHGSEGLEIRPQGRGYVAKVRGPGSFRVCAASGSPCSEVVTFP